MYFQVCSNSAYPQHSDERYRTNGPLVVDNIKEDCVLLGKHGSFKGSSTCCVRYVLSDLKRMEKYGSLNGT